MLYLLMIFLVIIGNTNSFQKGYFCVPVVDLVDAPFKSSNKQLIKDFYKNISLTIQLGKKSCLRSHQGIFNEEVTILNELYDQVQIELTNCYYCPMPNADTLPARFWTHKDAVITEQDLETQKISSLFPAAIFYKQKNNDAENVITLTEPWYDHQTNCIYSAGTRFILLDESNICEYIITFYSVTLKRAVIASVPKKSAISCNVLLHTDRKKAFVELLYRWASFQEGLIPFVWGGTSFSYLNNHKAPINLSPYCGFDASGLILRAAQIVGIEYYCINSITVANSLTLKEGYEPIEEGDIIWSPGYLAVVANLERNELIEAQGYDRGYGNVHAIALKDRFANCSTWKELFYLLNNKLPLLSFNSNKEIVQSVSYFKIFKLPN